VDSLKESRAALWVDVDNDGWLDLFVANDADAPAGETVSDPATVRNQLFRNRGDGTFEEIGAEAGIALMPFAESSQTVGGAAAADINRDGWIDIYVSCWQNANALYMNDGDGTFTETSQAANVIEAGPTWQPMFYDVDRDGWPDLLLNVDFGANRLYLNQRDGTFLAAPVGSGFDSAFNEMGMTLGDYDNDGDLDVLATNIETPYPDATELTKYTVLLENQTSNGTPAFVDRGLQAGVGRTGWGWGCTWFDADHDGWLDLGVTNGFVTPTAYTDDPSRLFHATGGGTFTEISAAAGFVSTLGGRGLIAFDADRDGDLDLLETNFNAPAAFYRNDTPPSGHYLLIDLRLDGSPAYVPGVELTLTAADWTRGALVSVGSSFLSQEPYVQHVGVGTATVVEMLTVRWPDGAVDQASNLSVDRRVRFAWQNGMLLPEDVNADGAVNGADAAALLSCLAGPTASVPIGCADADVNQDGRVDLADVAEWSRAASGA
jgi:hypothetical protein